MTEKKETLADDSEAEMGLGHDPLEWLQDDEEGQTVTPTESESLSAQTPESASDPEPTTASTYQIENQLCRLKVPDRLTIHSIETLYDEWRLLFSKLPNALQVDASDTQDADAAGVQLLYSLLKQLAFKGVEVNVVAVHPKLQQYFYTAGMTDFFAQYQHSA
ncbi:STAS domain-containing protein [Planctobacterium marinum]|uniref:STAS domain-containing protein n=1 Tax=Planctobacterium marinum TaxID=1631968 RepID=UPI001E54017F|nr:STAS domain-containing protein [Planctobacterium marinum]MCC2607807.1 STAS domain-containing protein [Planctobacterium marinum]